MLRNTHSDSEGQTTIEEAPLTEDYVKLNSVPHLTGGAPFRIHS